MSAPLAIGFMDTVSEAQQSLEKLKEEISCPICLKTFNEPKVLPCQHAYCKSPCLEQLARHGNGNISCPECRKVAQVPGNDVNNFPTAFRINRLKELLTSMEALPLAIATPPKDSPLGRCCKLHPFQHVDLYCSTCRRLICRDCVAIDRSHDSHDYDLVDKVAPAHKKALLDSLNPIAEIELDVTRALTEVARLKQAVEQQGSDVSKKVINSFDEIIAVVKKQRQSLLQTVQELTAEKVLMINNQEEVLLAAHGESHKLIDSVQDSTRNLTNEEFLSNREEVLLRISNVAGKFRNVGLTPVTVPNIAVQVVSAEKVAGLCAEDSMVYKLADPAECRAESVQHSAATNKVSDFVVHLADLGGDPCVGEQDVTAKLKSLKFGSTAEAQVAAISPSLYKVSYLPNIYTRGRCELTVKVNSVQITDSPFQVYVKCPPTQLNTPIKVIKDLPEPVGLTLSSEEELIVATKNELVVLGSNLTKTQTVKPPIPWRPFECVADRHSNIYVSDIQNPSLSVDSVAGERTLANYCYPTVFTLMENLSMCRTTRATTYQYSI